ncbi:hypothetical protein [Salibacterium aidingense]|uniref:hypothetical protein n=1 Tax=Salibacterium aidingense TaxID=384933 RepID=UPI000417CC4A|nr:hypothetical protein [Salibacterium aidingense]
MTEQFQDYVEQILAHWQEPQRKGAVTIINKYGLPQEATASRLIWYRNGPWKQTIVHRDSVPHHFPTTHPDFLEQTIDYKTPLGRFDEIAMYDGSVYPDRTKGEVSAVCDKEAMNFLSLNLFHDIVVGKRSVQEARCFYAQTAANFLFHQISSPYVEKFLFPQQVNTADPDVRFF